MPVLKNTLEIITQKYSLRGEFFNISRTRVRYMKLPGIR